MRRDAVFGAVFEDVSWNSPAVFSETMERFGRLDVEPAVLRMLADIDDLADLKRFYRGLEPEKIAPVTSEFISNSLAGLAPYETI
jgi:glycosyltransferase A (GT-A) superfamily protein (DUF2064 family)